MGHLTKSIACAQSLTAQTCNKGAGRKEEEGSEERKEGGESTYVHGAPALIAVYHSHRTDPITMPMGGEIQEERRTQFPNI